MTAIHWNGEQFTQAIRGDLPVLVDFWAPWCTYCRRIAAAYDKVAQQNEGRLLVAKIDIDQEPELAQAEQIEVVPTLVLYRKGQALGSLVAPDSKARIDQFLAETLNP